MVAPIQVRAVVNLDPKHGDPEFLITKIKASIVRLLIHPGFDVEVLGYANHFVQTSGNPYDGFRLQGAEILEVNADESVRVASAVELTFKMRATFHVGAAKRFEVGKHFDFGDLKEDEYYGKFMASGNVSGAFGVRISKRVLAEIFGGVDSYHARAFKEAIHSKGEERNKDDDYIVGKRVFLHPQVGARLSVTLLRGEPRMTSEKPLLQLTGQIFENFFTGDLRDDDDSRSSRALVVGGALSGHY